MMSVRSKATLALGRMYSYPPVPEISSSGVPGVRVTVAAAPPTDGTTVTAPR
jgi:hypothetical protein